MQHLAQDRFPHLSNHFLLHLPQMGLGSYAGCARSEKTSGQAEQTAKTSAVTRIFTVRAELKLQVYVKRVTLGSSSSISHVPNCAMLCMLRLHD